MKTNAASKKFASVRELVSFVAGTLCFCVLLANAHGAPTALGTEPFASSSKINALPNVMFILDDSGSMSGDYLPDWAGPSQATISGVLIVVTPPHRFFNGAYNGVAYNPATRYRPPVMYTNTGALDTTTYPSQTGQSASTGGDGTATALLPNWRAVKVDGYGIQSAATASLEGNAFSYSTVPGEYCDSVQLRNCVISAGPTGVYTFPAKLRWCTTSALSVDTTANAGTSCQASNIADTPTNAANGVTNYTFPRMPRPHTATISVNAAGTATGVDVGGQQILSADAVGLTSADVATAIVLQINACTYGIPVLSPASRCTVVGYSAVINPTVPNEITVTAPAATAATPVVAGVAAVSVAFSNGNVPGSSVLTVITPTVGSYFKSPNRSDCAAASCTYAEELTNYANWYAYYHTRMQMMKTSASIAFSAVNDKFRVGFYSINNGVGGAGSFFINPNAFDGAQKNLWYSTFLSATPFGATPLRTGLATIGRMYAGQFNGSPLNNVTVNEPLQYSCQQNFTILSTDGYWNDTSTPKQIDGLTDIGQQDAGLDRPYYDGGAQNKTISQTNKTENQTGINSFVLQSMTQQQQLTYSRLTQTVVTTDTYPFSTQTSTLQTQTTPLNRTDYALVQSTYPLTSTTKQLQESTYLLNSTPRPLQSYINNLTQTTTPLDQKTYKVTVGTQLLTQKDYKVTVGTQLLTKKDYNVTVGTQLLTQKDYNVTVGTQLLTENVYRLTRTTYALQSSTYLLQSSSRHLQERHEYSTDGGDTWQDTGWFDVNSCRTRASGPGFKRNTVCRYDTAVVVDNVNTCTSIAADPTSPYNVRLAVSCAYEAVPVVAAVATCDVVAQSAVSPYDPAVTCGYAAAPTVLNGRGVCTAHDETGLASMAGNKVTCAYDAAPSTTTNNLASCTWVVPSPAASLPRTDCSYQASVPLAGQAACTAAPLGTVTTNNTTWNTGVTCAYDAVPTTTSNLASCTWKVPAPAASAPKTDCSYQVSVPLAGQATCTAAPLGVLTTNNTLWSKGVSCAYDAVPTTTNNLASCTWKVPAPAASAPKTDCSYQVSVPLAGQATCTAAPLGTVTTDNTLWSTGVTCAYDAVPTTTPNLASCTWAVPGVAASAPKTDCSYQVASNSAGQATCTAVPLGTVTTNNTIWGTGVTCVYDAVPTTTSNVATCTWVVPVPAASAPRTDCAYNAGAASSGTFGTCTTVPASTGNANGTVWTGPIVSCAYAAAVLTGNNLATCTAGAPSGGPVFNAYTTCAYVNGVTTTGLNSCTYIPDSTGPVYTGPANACAYAAVPGVVNVASCTPVAQSPTFAAPQKTCAYEVVGTPASNLATCTNAPQSGSAPYSGPNVNCAYSGVPTVTNPATCTVNIEAGPSYLNGAKVSCGYAAGVPTNNVVACSVQAKQVALANGTVYAPATDCAYGATTAWVNASAACVPVPQSVASPYAGPARNCQYTAWSASTYAGTCVAVPQDNVNLTARSCSGTPVPVTISTVNTTVDVCSTAPTSGVSPVDPAATRDTATTCVYQAAATINAATCTPHAADSSSPYGTAVSCPVTNPGQVYVNVAACTPAGALPATFDATGKIVDCKTTDTTPYTAAYPSGPVPVASCIPGMNPLTFAQTRCTTMLSTGPTPVDPATCTTVNPGLAPDYVNTICTTTSTASTAIGCPNGVTPPTAPLWQTISCADVPNSGPIDTLADVAAYYYYTDLRTMTLGNCIGAVVPPAVTGSDLCTAADPMNNVPTTPKDPLSTQHMTTFTLGLGASGYMKFSGTYLTDSGGDYATVYGVAPHRAADGIAADPANGICSWQSSGNCNWPYPASDEQTTIDDLWHAGVNGHGAYFSATDPSSLSASLSTALASVAAAGGAAAAAAISNPNLAPGDNYVFSSTYTTVDWTGELVRQQLDPYTGTLSASIDWAVQAKLDAKASRNIYAFNGGTATKLIAFTSANFAANASFLMPNISTSPTGLTQFLCTSPVTCLSATDQDAAHASGANLVNFLRGDRSNEGVVDDNTKYYRQRLHLLGDMVNAETVYVNQPVSHYGDPGYSAFVAAQAARQAVVYAGANDGMLHAFAAKGTAATEAAVAAAAAANSAASLDPTNSALATAAASANATAAAAMAADALIGQELWAYIPSMIIPNLYLLADKDYKDRHHYYVDATPIVADICASGCNAAGTAVWKTILVGGLGRGGRGYYALDITDPTNPKALWEFTDANLGYSYGNPQIAKMSDGTWVVLLSSGYNNIPNPDGAGGDGIGRLYVLNADSGAQIAGVSPISTGFGSVASPSGLAKITAQVVNPDADNTVEAVYGGDLYGNLWRFDINNTVGAAGYDAQLLAILKDGSGNPQSITTKPEVALIPAVNVKVVYVGTGRFLDASDVSDTSQQSFYAIKDVRATGTTPATAIFDNPGGLGASPRGGLNAAGFVGQVQSEIPCPAAAAALLICNLGTVVRTSTDYPVDFSTGNGWFIDLIATSERANTNPALALGLLAFNTNAPSLAACDVGGKSYQYFVDYLTGGPIHAPGNYDPVLGIGYASRFVDNALSSDLKLVMTKDGKFITVTQLSNQNKDFGHPPPPALTSTTQRTSWRELIVE